MIIAELNYLEVVTETEVLGGTGVWNFKKDLNSNVKTNLTFKSDTDIEDKFYKVAYIDIYSDVYGNSSSFAFDNEAQGYNSNTQGSFNQLSVEGVGSSQNGLFVSAANF
jgi:hypothetical protein